MFETLGSCSWRTIYMSTQNGSHLEIWWNRILIHTLELKLWHLEVSPYVCTGKPCICNVFRPRATLGAGPRAHINVTTFTHFDQNWSIGCLLALYGSTKHPAQLCGGFFFFCLVSGLRKFTNMSYVPSIVPVSSVLQHLAGYTPSGVSGYTLSIKKQTFK